MTDVFEGLVTFCYVADLGRTARFYEDVLGLTLALDQGPCRIYRVRERAYVGFCTRDDAPRPDGVILTFVTPDVDRVCAELEARGAALEGRPKVNEAFCIYHAFLRDPDGYLLEIQRFEDPSWPGP